MVSFSKSLYLVIVAAGFALPASAVTPIYRCTQNGQTVLTDKPCEGNVTAPTSGTSGAPPSGTVGNQALAAPSVMSPMNESRMR